MQLREYISEKDFEYIKNWIDDERTHAMWCAGRFAYPLKKENFADVLSDMKDKWGDTPFLAMTDAGELAGFFCYSLNNETKEGMLKFIVVNPAFRGKGIAKEMLKATSDYAFGNGAELVHLNVFSENVKAKKCYLNAGFRERSFTENAFLYKDESWGRCNMVLKKDYCEKKYPTREEAEKILMEAEGCNPGPWGNHSRTAAHCAEAIASRSGMDSEKAYVLGLLHDIGRKFGKRHLGHVSDGYSYMMSLGYDDVARICLTHSFNEKDISKYVGKFDTTEEETALIKDGLNAIELDDYDRLIQLCDSIAGAEVVMDQIERMTDVKNRYGDYDQEKWDTNIRLRKHFEDMMGEDLYVVVDKENYRP